MAEWWGERWYWYRVTLAALWLHNIVTIYGNSLAKSTRRKFTVQMQQCNRFRFWVELSWHFPAFSYPESDSKSAVWMLSDCLGKDRRGGDVVHLNSHPIVCHSCGYRWIYIHLHLIVVLIIISTRSTGVSVGRLCPGVVSLVSSALVYLIL